jgi:coiled-coil domain-containing protein 63/114
LTAKKQKIALETQKAAVNQERLKLNQTKSTNQKYRREIDCLRKELTSALNECKRLTAGTKKAKKISMEQNKQQMVHLRLAEDHTCQAIALMSTHEADKKKFDSDIAKMKANL